MKRIVLLPRSPVVRRSPLPYPFTSYPSSSFFGTAVPANSGKGPRTLTRQFSFPHEVAEDEERESFTALLAAEGEREKQRSGIKEEVVRVLVFNIYINQKT